MTDGDVGGAAVTTRPAADIAVMICSDISAQPSLPDEARQALFAHGLSAEVVLVDRLSEGPTSALEALRATTANRAVVAVRQRDVVAESELRTRARRAGFGPYDVAFVAVNPHATPAAAARAVSALATRILLTPGDEPTRTVFTRGALSRRALLRPGSAVSVEAAARVDRDRCSGFDRCGICASVCPMDAINARQGLAEITASACDSCALCVSACPPGAIHLGGAAPAQIESQIAQLLEAPIPPGIVFACSKAATLAGNELNDWPVVELPSLEIMTPGWLMQTLLEGAPTIRLTTCASGCCAAWREGGRYLDLCKQLLAVPANDATATFSLDRGTPDANAPRTETHVTDPVTFVEPAATVSALEKLGSTITLVHPGSPLGLLACEPGCTACTACAIVCPTGALFAEESENGIRVLHDPSRCTGCGLCVPTCPEQVLRLERGIDTGRLESGPIQLAAAQGGRCARCREPLPPHELAERARRLLVQTWPRLDTGAVDLCLHCALLESHGAAGCYPSDSDGGRQVALGPS